MRVKEAANRAQHLPNKLFRVRRSCQNIEALRQRLNLAARHLLGRAHCFFRAFAFSYIDNSADELDQIAGVIANRMTDRMNTPDRTAGMNNSIVRFKLTFLANRFFEQFPDSALVLRTKALEESFESRRSHLRIETEHAISFLRPVPDFPGSGRPCPTPGMAEPLRFRQIRFALSSG